MTTWIAVLAVGVGSYGLRTLPLFVPWLATPPAWAERMLGAAGTASLTALATVALHHQLTGAPLAYAAATVAAVVTGAVLAVRGHPLWLVAVAGLAVHLVAGAVAAAMTAGLSSLG
jgi:branched-subunit amino acid transport protein